MSTYSFIDGSSTLVIIPIEDVTRRMEISKTNPNYPQAKQAIIDGAPIDEVEVLCSPAKSIQSQIDSEDYNGIQIVNGVLTYQGEEVIASLATRIVRLYAEGFPLKPLALFAERLWRNPDEWVRYELDLFLEACELPITPDGHFLAYKKVRSDYTDIHSGTFDNSIGKTPSMDRSKVEKNRHRTCAAGLHFCSESYLPQFGSSSRTTNRVMVVKVSPEDVVSIPSDYANAKGRAWRYQVVGEITQDEALTKKWPAVVHEYGSPEPAEVVKSSKTTNKNPNGAFNIQTKQLGTLNAIHAANALKKYGSATAWANAHGWPASTVRDWVRKLRSQGALL